MNGTEKNYLTIPPNVQSRREQSSGGSIDKAGHP